MLGNEIEGGTGAPEMERVSLRIPAGLLMIAQFIAGRETLRQDWIATQAALKKKDPEGRALRKAVNERLAEPLKKALLEELRLLGTGDHPMLRAAAKERGWKEIRPDQIGRGPR